MVATRETRTSHTKGNDDGKEANHEEDQHRDADEEGFDQEGRDRQAEEGQPDRRRDQGAGHRPQAQRMRSKRGASGCDSVRDHATGCESRRFGPQKRKPRKLASVGSLRDNLRLSATWCETMRLSAKVAEEGLEPPTRGL